MGSEVLVPFYQGVKSGHVTSPLPIHFMNGGYFARKYDYWMAHDHFGTGGEIKFEGISIPASPFASRHRMATAYTHLVSILLVFICVLL